MIEWIIVLLVIIGVGIFCYKMGYKQALRDFCKGFMFGKAHSKGEFNLIGIDEVKEMSEEKHKELLKVWDEK